MIVEGVFKTLAVSLKACFAAIVWNAATRATRVDPYLFARYAMTSSRRTSDISISISGIEFLLIFKNLSNKRLYLIGLTSVIPRQ